MFDNERERNRLYIMCSKKGCIIKLIIIPFNLINNEIKQSHLERDDICFQDNVDSREILYRTRRRWSVPTYVSAK